MARGKVEAPVASELLFLPTDSIRPNPNNPRLIFDEGDMALLTESIRRIGVLVPLLVYKRKKDGAFVVLDGERRLRAAKSIGLSQVPANIIPEPDLLANLLTMFNIHNTRIDWEPMPTALKIEVITRETKTRDPKFLAQLTGMTQANVKRCLTLLEFEKKYQDMMLAPKSDRIKADYFVEMARVLNKVEREYKGVIKRYSRKDLADKFVEKIRDNVITTPIEFRQLWKVLNISRKGASKNTAERAFLGVVGQKDRKISDAYASTARKVYELERIERLAKEIISLLEDLEAHSVADRNFRGLLLRLEREIRRVTKGGA